MMNWLAKSLPIQGTEYAARYDALYWFLVAISAVFFVGVVGAMIYYSIRYRERVGHKAKYIDGHVGLEILWTVIPTFLVLGIFVWGWVVYRDLVTTPMNAMEVRVVGKQWMWQFQYEDGRITTNDLVVPINKQVKIVMSSEDVLHSFFIPNFRIKQDVVPGMYTTLWFEAKVPGKHHIFCAEYCGGNHSGMVGSLIVLQPKEYERWQMGEKIQLSEIPEAGEHERGKDEMAQLSRTSLADQGHDVFKSKGCVACHTADGTQASVAPDLKGIFGKEVALEDGSTKVRDENYLRAAIERPYEKTVKGYAAAATMPVFQGVLTETELNAVIHYIKSLK
jgi:cytochrome c oxidase subunit II